MKRLFFAGFFILTLACQTATVTPNATATIPAATLVQDTPTIAAPTETLIPTQTLSPTPAPRFFTEDFNSNLSSWVTFQTNGQDAPRVSAENGDLVFRLDIPNSWGYAVYDAHEYKKVFLQTQFTLSANAFLTVGAICHYSTEKGWFEYNVSTDGTYSVLHAEWLEPGIAQYTPIVYDTTEYLTPNQTSYALGLACDDKFLWLYINDKLFRKLDVSRYGATQGKVGLTASSFESAPVTVSFDFITISEP